MDKINDESKFDSIVNSNGLTMFLSIIYDKSKFLEYLISFPLILDKYMLAYETIFSFAKEISILKELIGCICISTFNIFIQHGDVLLMNWLIDNEFGDKVRENTRSLCDATRYSCYNIITLVLCDSFFHGTVKELIDNGYNCDNSSSYSNIKNLGGKSDKPIIICIKNMKQKHSKP